MDSPRAPDPSQAVHHAILDALPAHIALIDTNGTVISVNEAWRRFASANVLRARDYAVGANYITVCERASGHCSDEAGEVCDGIRAVLSGTLPEFALEYPCHSPDQQRWFRVMVTPLHQGTPDGAIVMHIDVTERKLAVLALERAVEEQQRLATELRTEQQRLLMAQEVARIGGWETNHDTLEVHWTAETYRIFGLDPATTRPTHAMFLEMVHPDDREEVDAAFVRSFETREVSTISHRIVTADGTVKHVEERWQTLLDERGRPQRAMGTCQDVSERKQLELQFLRAQRLESLGTLAGGIAHDLNNVLAPILASIELLRLDVMDPASLDTLDVMERSARRGADLVRQVLAFARGVEGRRVAVHVGDVVRDVQRMVMETFPKAIAVEVDVADGLPAIAGDPTQLHQVLMNLCVNARDAMPSGGTLSIQVMQLHLDATQVAALPGLEAGPHLRWSVTDTGQGIPLAIQDRLFEPFFTTKPIGQGTGLGLSTVHSIVRSHGGAIAVSSDGHSGARFTVYLPVNGIDFDGVEPAASTAAIPRGRGEVILVVDDEPAIRHVVGTMLERHGYRVLVAEHGGHGVAMYMEHQAAIAAVVTDMSMPVMDGPTMIAAIRGASPELPVIGSSGRISGGMLSPYPGSGPVQFVPKPYTSAALLQALHLVLGDRETD